MCRVALVFGLGSAMLPLLEAADSLVNAAPSGNALTDRGSIWREPTDIKSLNLFYGAGGEKDQPHPPFTFVEEDGNGTNPKYVVQDRDKVKWTVKLGNEAQPETAATRLLWAVGFYTDEDYFLPSIQVAGLPSHLKRGGDLVSSDGTMKGARLKRHISEGWKSAGWRWRSNLFDGTRALNGLKVMMALINNWDLKDENNKVYTPKDGKVPIYLVSDLGASFGSTGLTLPFSHSKGYLDAYVSSSFITKVTAETVDFGTPGAPALPYAFALPDYVRRLHLDTLLHDVPIADVRWMGRLLAGLSADQIRDAFRAAGLPQDQIDGYTAEVQSRIAKLNSL